MKRWLCVLLALALCLFAAGCVQPPVEGPAPAKEPARPAPEKTDDPLLLAMEAELTGARPGDVVAYRGRLGMAAAGLAVLARGFRSPGAVVRAQRIPEPPYGPISVRNAQDSTRIISISARKAAETWRRPG